MPIRVLIADDHVLFRNGLRDAMGQVDDIEIVGEADTGRTAIAQSYSLRPDVVLMDLQMPEGGGVEAVREVRRLCPTTQVLVLTAYGDIDLFQRAAVAGAAGYVLKDITVQNLAAAIRAVHRGDTMINPGIARHLLKAIAQDEDDRHRRPLGLTDREMEILVSVALGLSDRELGAKLFLAESTVKSHLRGIYRKLNVRNRVQAAAYAIQNNLMTAHSLAETKTP